MCSCLVFVTLFLFPSFLYGVFYDVPRYRMTYLPVPTLPESVQGEPDVPPSFVTDVHPGSRFGAGAASNDHYFYVHGGEPVAGNYATDLWRFDPLTGFWEWIEPSGTGLSTQEMGTMLKTSLGTLGVVSGIPSPRKYHAMSSIWNSSGVVDRLRIFGGLAFCTRETCGQPVADTHLSELWEFHLERRIWNFRNVSGGASAAVATGDLYYDGTDDCPGGGECATLGISGTHAGSRLNPILLTKKGSADSYVISGNECYFDDMGGFDACNNRLFRFDDVTSEWHIVIDVTPSGPGDGSGILYESASGFLFDSFIFVYGGNFQGSPGGELFRANLTSGTWTELPRGDENSNYTLGPSDPHPDYRAYTAMAFWDVGEFAVMFGGQDDGTPRCVADGRILADLWGYFPKENRWMLLPMVQTDTDSLACDSDGTFYSSGYHARYNDSLLARPPGRFLHSVAVVGSRTFVMFGGMEGWGRSSRADVWTLTLPCEPFDPTVSEFDFFGGEACQAELFCGRSGYDPVTALESNASMLTCHGHGYCDFVEYDCFEDDGSSCQYQDCRCASNYTVESSCGDYYCRDGFLKGSAESCGTVGECLILKTDLGCVDSVPNRFFCAREDYCQCPETNYGYVCLENITVAEYLEEDRKLLVKWHADPLDGIILPTGTVTVAHYALNPCEQEGFDALFVDYSLLGDEPECQFNVQGNALIEVEVILGSNHNISVGGTLTLQPASYTMFGRDIPTDNEYAVVPIVMSVVPDPGPGPGPDPTGEDVAALIGGAVGGVLGSLLLLAFLVIVAVVVALVVVQKRKVLLRGSTTVVQKELILDQIELIENPQLRETFHETAGAVSVAWEDLEITEKSLGSGGSGAVVRLARWNAVDVALKLFKLDTDTTPKELRELLKEAKLMEDLKHPNLIQFFGLTFNHPYLGLVMMLCTDSLKGFLKKFKAKTGKSRPFRTKTRLMFEIACAMEYLHTNDVIHRDLKLENVLIDENDGSRVMDYGLARTVNDSTSSDKTVGVGTRLYMAPEIVTSGNYDAKVDVFSYAMLCFVVTTEMYNPYDASDEFVHFRVANDPNVRPDISKIASQRYSWLKTLITSCWSHRPEERPSFAAVCATLKRRINTQVTTIFVRTENQIPEDAEDFVLSEWTMDALIRIGKEAFGEDSVILGVEEEIEGCEEREPILLDEQVATLDDDTMLVFRLREKVVDKKEEDEIMNSSEEGSD